MTRQQAEESVSQMLKYIPVHFYPPKMMQGKFRNTGPSLTLFDTRDRQPMAILVSWCAIHGNTHGNNTPAHFQPIGVLDNQIQLS